MRKPRRGATRQLLGGGWGGVGELGRLRGRLSCTWGGVRFGISCCSSPLSGVGGQAVPGWEVSLEAPHPAHLVFLFPCKSDARRTWLKPCCLLPCPGSRDPLSGEILSACPCWILELAPGGTGGPSGQSRVPRIGPEGWGLPPLSPPPSTASLRGLSLLLTCPPSTALEVSGNKRETESKSEQAGVEQRGDGAGKRRGRLSRELFQPWVTQTGSELPSSQGKRERS